MENLTEHGNHKIFRLRLCSAELTGGVHFQLMCLTVFSILLSITAILGNSLILVALQKESSLHPSTKHLFRSLATSDLCIGLISEPLTFLYWMSVVYERWDICPYVSTSSFISGLTLCSISLLTLTAISVDRLLALLLGLRYRYVVTLKRIQLAVTTFWLVSIFSATTYFWNYHITLWYRYIAVAMCLVISTFSYGKIFSSCANITFKCKFTDHRAVQANWT